MEKIFKKELIELRFKNKSNNKFEVIEEIIFDLASKIDFGIDKKKVANEVKKREKISTTGFGQNIAIAHSQIEGLNETFVALYRFEKDVEWESLDGKKVKQSFVLLVPKEDESSSHMKILSNLARKLMQEEFISNIKTINDKDKLINYLETNN